MSLTAVNYSCAYELSSPLFLGFGAGALPAAALLFLPSLILLFSLHQRVYSLSFFSRPHFNQTYVYVSVCVFVFET